MKYLIQDYKIRRQNNYPIYKSVFWLIVELFESITLFNLLMFINDKLYNDEISEYGLKDTNHYDDIGYVCNTMVKSSRNPFMQYYHHECGLPQHVFKFKFFSIYFENRKFKQLIK